MDACYYSIIERGEDGHFWGWVPDLPGVTADGRTEQEVLDRLLPDVRACLRNLIVTGEPVPRPRICPGATARANYAACCSSSADKREDVAR